jgi:hypothetical protein
MVFASKPSAKVRENDYQAAKQVTNAGKENIFKHISSTGDTNPGHKETESKIIILKVSTARYLLAFLVRMYYSFQ